MIVETRQMLNKNKKIILSFVFILAVFLIFFQFTDTPKVWVDEGLFTEMAKNVALHGVWGVQTAPGVFSLMNVSQISVSYPVILPVALSLKIFGNGIWQARLPMVLYMLVLVFLFYFFSKKRYGFYPAILSVLSLISFSPFYGNGRPVLGEVPGLVFGVLGVWFLLLWEESSFKNKKWALLSGLAFGLAAATKEIFLLGIPLALIISLILWFKKIEDKKTLAIFWLSFVPPVLIWAYIHLISSNSLLNFIPNFLHLASNHSSSISLTHTILNNLARFFTETTPILFMFLFVVVVTSFILRYFKIKSECFSVSECVLISFIILNWIGYLGGTGWYRYFLPAHILVYLIFPGAVYIIARNTEKVFLKKILYAVPVILIVLQFIHLIFLSDTSFTDKRTRNSDLASVLSKIDSSKRILFYGTIETPIFLKGDNYSQYFYLEGCFLEGGDKKALVHPSEDFILTGIGSPDFNLPCYSRKSVDRYFLFQKIDNCKKR
jgi:4-amino-4-deoxy-L-arabinose transferase-like glycosyltransferase